MFQFTNIYILAAFGTLGGALFGFQISSMSAWIGAPQFLDYFNRPDSNLIGGITASMSAGSFAGSLASGFISDRLGRRKALMVAAIIWNIGAILQASAVNVAHLIVGQVVGGLSIGITSSQCCVYLAELAPARIRGRIVGIQQWSIEWGILIMYLISYGCYATVDSPAAFRIAWGVQVAPGTILFCSLFFFPESPRWLAQHERWDESLHVLAALHAKGDINSSVVQLEFEEVQEAARIAKEQQDVSFLALFGPKVIKRTICGLSVQMWQQLLGGNVAMYYVVYIFEMAGMSGDTTLYSAIIQYVIFVVTTGSILPIIDKLGRRNLLIYGAIACMIIHFATAGVMATYGRPVDSVNDNENLRWQIDGNAGRGVIALSYIFVGVYGWTWAPAAWIYCSEVFPMRYRAKGVGAAAATNWAFNFALAYFVAPAFTNIQWRTYIIFGVFCTVMTFHVFLTYPETAGKSLEEMDYLFNAKIPAWKSASVKGFEEKVQERAAGDGESAAGAAKSLETPADVQAEGRPAAAAAAAEKEAGANHQEDV